MVEGGKSKGKEDLPYPTTDKGQARDMAGKNRRQLTPSQASMCAARAREIYERQAKERMVEGGKSKGKEDLPYPTTDKGQARDMAGKAFGVSGKSVDHATKGQKSENGCNRQRGSGQSLAFGLPMPRKARYTPEDDLEHRRDIRAARAGDQAAMDRLWIIAQDLARARAVLTTGRYTWLDPSEFEQELLIRFPKILALFDVDGPNPFSKFLYFSFVWRSKDVLRFARLENEIAQKKSVLDEISPKVSTKGFRKGRPKPKAAAKRKFRKHVIRKNSLQNFLRTKKAEKVKKMSQEDVMTSEQAEQQTAPEQQSEQAAAPKPEHKGWPKGKKRPATKKKAPAKKVAKSKAPVAPSAFDQLALAGKFADSCGGISKAIQLLTTLQGIRK